MVDEQKWVSPAGRAPASLRLVIRRSFVPRVLASFELLLTTLAQENLTVVFMDGSQVSAGCFAASLDSQFIQVFAQAMILEDWTISQVHWWVQWVC